VSIDHNRLNRLSPDARQSTPGPLVPSRPAEIGLKLLARATDESKEPSASLSRGPQNLTGADKADAGDRVTR